MISSAVDEQIVKMVTELKEAACRNSQSCAMLVTTIQRNKGALARTLKNNSKKINP